MSLTDVMAAVDTMGGGPKLKRFIVLLVILAALIGATARITTGAVIDRQHFIELGEKLDDRITAVEGWKKDVDTWRTQTDEWKTKVGNDIHDTRSDVKWIKSRLGGPPD